MQMIPVSEIRDVIQDLELRYKLCFDHGSYNRADAFKVSIESLKAVLERANIPSVRLSTNAERIE